MTQAPVREEEEEGEDGASSLTEQSRDMTMDSPTRRHHNANADGKRPRASPLRFRLLPAKRRGGAVMPVLTCEVNGVEIVRTLDPEGEEPFISASRIFSAASRQPDRKDYPQPITPLAGLVLSQLRAPSYTTSLGSLTPFIDIWVPLAEARRIAEVLELDLQLAALLDWSTRHAFTLDDFERGDLVHNWHIPTDIIDPDKYSTAQMTLASFTKLELAKEGKEIRTQITKDDRYNVSNVNSRQGDVSGAGPSPLGKLREDVIIACVHAYEEWMDAVEAGKVAGPSRALSLARSYPAKQIGAHHRGSSIHSNSSTDGPSSPGKEDSARRTGVSSRLTRLQWSVQLGLLHQGKMLSPKEQSHGGRILFIGDYELSRREVLNNLFSTEVVAREMDYNGLLEKILGIEVNARIVEASASQALERPMRRSPLTSETQPPTEAMTGQKNLEEIIGTNGRQSAVEQLASLLHGVLSPVQNRIEALESFSERHGGPRLGNLQEQFQGWRSPRRPSTMKARQEAGTKTPKKDDSSSQPSSPPLNAKRSSEGGIGGLAKLTAINSSSGAGLEASPSILDRTGDAGTHHAEILKALSGLSEHFSTLEAKVQSLDQAVQKKPKDGNGDGSATPMSQSNTPHKRKSRHVKGDSKHASKQASAEEDNTKQRSPTQDDAQNDDRRHESNRSSRRSSISNGHDKHHRTSTRSQDARRGGLWISLLLRMSGILLIITVLIGSGWVKSMGNPRTNLRVEDMTQRFLKPLLGYTTPSSDDQGRMERDSTHIVKKIW